MCMYVCVFVCGVKHQTFFTTVFRSFPLSLKDSEVLYTARVTDYVSDGPVVTKKPNYFLRRYLDYAFRQRRGTDIVKCVG